jgi:hypothetical protein
MEMFFKRTSKVDHTFGDISLEEIYGTFVNFKSDHISKIIIEEFEPRTYTIFATFDNNDAFISKVSYRSLQILDQNMRSKGYPNRMHHKKEIFK